MWIGFAIVLLIVFKYDYISSFGLFGELISILFAFGLAIPLILTGSIMNGTAPKKLLKRYRKWKHKKKNQT